MDLHGRDQFDRAYTLVRDRIRNGHYRPGEPIAVKDIAAVLRISQTPVREVLAHLAGGRIIGERRGAGYFALPVTANDIGELYLLRSIYLDAAIAAAPGLAARVDWTVAAGADDAAAAATLFATIISAARIALLADAADAVAERLVPITRLERQLIMVDPSELTRLCTAGKNGNRTALRKSLRDYHRRRSAAAVAFAAALRAER
jgi:DNA-binding GntR family transcriptional regulator